MGEIDSEEEKMKLLVNKCNFSLIIKFLILHFEIIKRSVDLQLKMHEKFVINLIDFIEENTIEEKIENKNEQSKQIEIMNEILEDIFSVFSNIFKLFNNKILEILNYKNIETFTVHNYLQMNFLLKKIVNFFDKNVKPGLNYRIDCSSEISLFFAKKINILIDKISISSLNNFILDIEKGK